MKTSEIKRRLKGWGAKVQTEEITTDPHQYMATINLRMYEVDYETSGIGETRHSAFTEAAQAMYEKAL